MSPTSRRLKTAELEALCTAFLRLPGMRESSTRDLYVEVLSHQLPNTFAAARHLDPRHDVWALLQACQDHVGGIREFAAVVRAFHRGSRPMIELDELIECMFPEELLNPAEREELIALLADVDPRCLRLAGRYAGPPSWLASSTDWSDPATAVRRLESYIGVPGTPPPLLVFVDFVAHQVDGTREAAQHRWIDRVGSRENLTGETLRQLCGAAMARLDEVQRFYLIVELRPDGVDPDGYLMSVWLQQHHAVEEPLQRDDVPLTLTEIMARFPDLVHRAHAVLGIGLGEMVVEFILPRNLISHPVDQWEIDEIFPHRLGTSCPVVVRSLDRLYNRELHGAWRQKWRTLSTNGHRIAPDTVFWLLAPGSRTPKALHANLRREQTTCAVAMTFPPQDQSTLMMDELTAAFYAGIPVMLWCRDTSLRHRFEQEIRAMLLGRGVAELPLHVMSLRQRADETENADSPLGRHLTLLWDDADRIPLSFRSNRLRAPQ
jgi:hypothetical protein